MHLHARAGVQRGADDMGQEVLRLEPLRDQTALLLSLCVRLLIVGERVVDVRIVLRFDRAVRRLSGPAHARVGGNAGFAVTHDAVELPAGGHSDDGARDAPSGVLNSAGLRAARLLAKCLCGTASGEDDQAQGSNAQAGGHVHSSHTKSAN